MVWKIIKSKSDLAVKLSRISGFVNPQHIKEQYMTDSETAADLLWNAYLLGDIEGKKIADMGCGAGILGIGAALLGCRQITFVDEDERALAIASSNYARFELEWDMPPALFEKASIEKWKPEKQEVVVMNPPFGTRIRHIDREFLRKAFETADIIYSFHKTSTKEFIRRYSSKNGFSVTHEWDYLFPLKATQAFHTRRIRRIEVTAFRFAKKDEEGQ
ncbi:DNA methylase [Candidatus Woesearchaeota archaeon]|nr:MAG: DNA methylase [Candidatus Woesearchaeota archaeon]